jgi:hypothetical protein
LAFFLKTNVVTIDFFDFRLLSAKQLAFFLKNQCCDHWFLRFSPTFGETIAVFLKNKCNDQNFAQISRDLNMNANLCSKKLAKILFKSYVNIKDINLNKNRHSLCQ